MLHIKEPYYTAGKKFNWVYKPIGIGIAMRHLEGEGILEMTIGDSPKIWQIEKDVAKRFICDLKTYHDAKGTRLGVVPWQILTPKQEEIKQESML